MRKRYVISAMIAAALTLGYSQGEAKAKKDFAHGKSVKAKMMKKHVAKKAAKKRHH